MPPESTFYPPGTELAGKYRVERLLGQGGMGAVYVAEHLGINRKVALKVLLPQFAFDPELLARFRNEARAASAIHHAGIVEMLDVGTGPAGEPFLVMELLEGESLGARMRRAGALELDVAAWIVLQLLDAVGAAHAQGIVHRDLKPDNVFLVVSPRTAVKILDFGISKFHQDEEPSLTSTRTVLGTPAYMAPEQARSARAAGPAADLYAVGGILYEALTGAPPFEGQSYNEVVAKLLTEPHRPLGEVRPDLPPALSQLVDDLLAKAPQNRPADAAEAAARLRSALASAVATPDLRGMVAAAPADLLSDTIPKGSSPPPAEPSAAASPAPAAGATTEREPPRRRSALVIGGAAAGVLALAALVGAVVWRSAPVAATAIAALDAAAAQGPDSGVDAGEQADAAEPGDAEVNGPDASLVDAGRPRGVRHVVDPIRPVRRPLAADAGRASAAPDAGRKTGRLEPDLDSNPYLSK
ncbi:MAG TPA: serine/threonine-protein kinase [Myxococcales bacterium]|jgi:serine/threonine-protein kinase